MRSFLAAAALLSVASASPYASPATNIQAEKLPTRADEPCAQVSSLLKGVSDPTQVKIDADVALSCLRSVPLDAQNGPAQLLGLDTITDFQSTLAYLKDPPAGYVV